jgi:hypothetical protein
LQQHNYFQREAIVTVIALKDRKILKEADKDESFDQAYKNVPNALQALDTELAALYAGTFTDRELRALSSLVAYVTETQNVGTEVVLGVLTTAFGVTDVKELERDQFDDVIRYLINFKFAEAIN